MRTLRLIAALVCVAAHPVQADTLREIYELSLQQDPRLKMAAATYRANKEAEVQARSRLLPQINAEASYTKTDREQDSIGIITDPTAVSGFGESELGADLDANTTAWSVSLTQPLFDLPAWFSFRSGREFSRQAEAQFAYDQQELILRVAEAYFSVLRAGDNLRASQAEERAIKRQLDQTQNRFEVGLTAITDVHESRAAADAAVAVRLLDEGNLARAYEALTVLTGRTHSNLHRLGRDFPIAPPTPNDLDQWVSFAAQNNQALKAALYGMQAAQDTASARNAEHLPKITASLGYQDEKLRGDQDYDRPALFGTDPDTDTTTSSATIRLTVPIFTGGYTSSAQRQAQEQYNVALERRVETERGIVQYTRSHFIAVNTDVQRVHARAQSIVSARSALDATTAGYEVGTRNVVDILQTQRVLYNAARDYANARYDYVIDTLRLKQQAGTLTPQDIQDLDKWLVAPDAPAAQSFEELGEAAPSNAPAPKQ